MKKIFSFLFLFSFGMFLGSYSFAEETRNNAETISKVLILMVDNSSEWASVADKIMNRFNSGLYKAKCLGIDMFIANQGILSYTDLLVIIPGFSLPTLTAPTIMEFIKRGGDLIVLGAPLWNNDFIWDGKRCVKPIQFVKEHFSSLLPHLFSFAEGNVKDWQRESNNMQSPVVFEYQPLNDIIPNQTFHGFHASIIDMKGWDIFATPPLENPFPNNHQVTVFFAKGTKTTDELTIEWREKDGSRWIASVPLSEEWQFYALTSDRFKLWESPSRIGTSFNPQNAINVCIGLTMSHSSIAGGRHEFWFAGLGTAPMTSEHQILLQTTDLPKLELFYPEYKFYTSNDVCSISTDTELALKEMTMPVPKQFLLIHPRPRGGGFDKHRSWRWIPLIHAWGKGNSYRGTLSAMMIYNNEPYKNSVQACFAVQDAEWYLDKQFMEYFSQWIKKLREGIFLIDGGCSYYTVFPDQKLPMGATVLMTTETDYSNASIQLLLRNRNRKLLWEDVIPIQLSKQEIHRVVESIPYPRTMADNIQVECYLIVNGEKKDYVYHGLNRWKPRTKKEFVEVKHGDFIYRGKRWCPHGVNYMPSSGIGVEWWRYFEYWMGAEAYDPWIIQRDLQRIADMGMNSISVFQYYDVMNDQNLLDLLYRADRLGLKVNLSLRPGTPFDFEWDKIKEMIEYYRLPEHDEVFAYDLAWEPMFPGHEGRKRWDKEWVAWVIERYGSIENAEKDWKYPIPRDENGNVTNPKDEMMTKEGEWRIMVCAYRRFLDTLLYEYYNRARTLVRSVDTNHAVSFRMTEGSNPTNNWANPLPYDWYYLSQAVDILEPEAYGRIGNWEMVKPGWFQVKYGTYCNPDIPLFWAEIGYSVYRKNEEQTQRALQFQADYFTDFYNMLYKSGSDGVYFWWYPGGYRVNEKSDYGIINPDGTYRPATLVIKEHANIFRKQKFTPHDCEIKIDRDKTSMGVAGIYNDVKETFWQLIDKGKNPKLISEGTGKNSQNCPLIAVGNIPYNSSNPPKYLDAFFDSVMWVDGKEVKLICKGDTIKITNNADKIKVRVICTNLGEAEWVAGSKHMLLEGEVALLVCSEQEQQRIPLRKSLKRGETTEFCFEISVRQETSIQLTMESFNRALFGPKFIFKINQYSIT
ncbi:MAG: hypothetical protein LDL53_10200 [Candidatus Hydrogenedens sp.]|nr:hypothetical protein [Candidatus Hydrogenedens sp.]